MAYVFFFGWGVCRAGETFLGVTKKNPTQNTQNKKKSSKISLRKLPASTLWGGASSPFAEAHYVQRRGGYGHGYWCWDPAVVNDVRTRFFRGVLKGLVDFELVQTLQSLFLFFSLGPALLDAPHRTFNTWLASCYSSIRPSIYWAPFLVQTWSIINGRPLTIPRKKKDSCC